MRRFPHLGEDVAEPQLRFDTFGAASEDPAGDDSVRFFRPVARVAESPMFLAVTGSLTSDVTLEGVVVKRSPTVAVLGGLDSPTD